MARFVSKNSFADAIALGRHSGTMNLMTDEGQVRFHITYDDGEIISGTTEDNRLVLVNVNEPNNIVIK